jgi:uncharacterized Ntn-hydrolase superfamily protein
VTFSVVARSADGSCWGVAVASKFLAVGSAVPAAAAGVGALATQAWANLAYRPDGLGLRREGRSAQQVVDELTGADPEREHRQLGVVDRDGRSATYTGRECLAWAGGRCGPGYAVQGNILAGEQVVAALERAWLASDPTAPLARRLLAALEAGDGAGGDRRGRQSAAVYVVKAGGGYGGTSDAMVDLRVDDHEAPIPELARLLDLHDLYFGEPDPARLLPFTGALLTEVGGLLRQVGRNPGGTDPAEVRATLSEWASETNLEERMREEGLDPLVLEALRQRAATVEAGPVRPPAG